MRVNRIIKHSIQVMEGEAMREKRRSGIGGELPSLTFSASNRVFDPLMRGRAHSKMNGSKKNHKVDEKGVREQRLP